MEQLDLFCAHSCQDRIGISKCLQVCMRCKSHFNGNGQGKGLATFVSVAVAAGVELIPSDLRS